MDKKSLEERLAKINETIESLNQQINQLVSNMNLLIGSRNELVHWIYECDKPNEEVLKEEIDGA